MPRTTERREKWAAVKEAGEQVASEQVLSGVDQRCHLVKLLGVRQAQRADHSHKGREVLFSKILSSDNIL